MNTRLVEVFSSLQGEGPFLGHRQVLAVAPHKTFVKVVLTDQSTGAEIERAAALVEELAPRAHFLLQPATPFDGARPPEPHSVLAWARSLRERLPHAAVVPQWH